ncbi:PDK repeat-containing protein [Owenweeksia hongkongensis DSM 17368]|uniref:PDK repeat-containing protein n=1 Tax=Owenweeksia hongkongensis (strain DSM 17368 / CIP 108786 / JCM 12287 / NRRL B-23963 / UST20020801) TaxID=926562 RepID=G8R0D5_OWEHD|nr:PKD domain-containing protein [Owenweeksia hongkongensis]AEV31595.1 PDK repeat-containing protein [Owenweeksia hongkongensis DSM 17368]
MKKIITILAILFFSSTIYAGHEIGAIIITYKPVAGQPLQYEVTIKALYEGGVSAITPPSSTTLNIDGSCFTNFTQNFPRVGVTTGSVVPVLGADYCNPAGSAIFFQGIAEYKGTVTLPAHCADIIFHISAGFGRFNFATNIQGNFDTPYFYAKLNTMVGSNNSPQVPDLDFMQIACLNKSVSLFGYTDTDGDSLFFQPTTPQKKSGTSISNFSWATGYSQNTPLGTSSSYSLNSSTGAAQVSISNVGQYIIPIKYKEYRYDPTVSASVLIGEGIFNLSVSSTNACSAVNSISIQHESIPNSDSIQCGSNKIRFIGSRQLSRGSLSISGSDIEVSSVKQGSLAISSAILIQDSIVEVTLAQAAPLGDTLSLVAKVGTDGNVIISRCGTELTAYDDTLTYYTKGGVLPSAIANVSNQFLNTQYNSGSSVGDSLWWDFGDGNGSSSQSGNHNYNTAGTYTVKLISFGDCGITDTSTIVIQVCDSISANFNYTQAGDTVSFYSLSSAGVSNYFWDFGDGQTSTGDSTSHVYSTGGTYTAVLTVTNVCGDTVVFSMTVETCLPPLASWTYTVISTTSAGMTVDFDGTASTNAASYIWDFGDGTTDNSTLTPRHIYQTPGLHYYVKLTVDNTCQQSSEKGFKLNEIGIDELGVEPRFEVYPNPVGDVVNISLSENIGLKNISVYDLNGKKLNSEKVLKSSRGETIKFSTQHLNAGSYLLELESDKGETYRKVIVKK